jgi:hypothetical protein
VGTAIAPSAVVATSKEAPEPRRSHQTSLNWRDYQRGDPTAAAENCTFPKTPL